MADGGNGKPMSRYQKQLKGRQGQSAVRLQGQLERRVGGTRESRDRAKLRLDGDAIDSKFGFDRLTEGLPREGWLLNYLPITMPDESGIEKSGLDLYFIDSVDNSNFKASIFYEPYFYIDVSDPRRLMEISNQLLRKFEGCRVEQIEKEDLDLPNHLSGKKHPFLKISFGTVSDLMDAKNALRPVLQENQKRMASSADYFFGSDGAASGLDIWDEGAASMTSSSLAGRSNGAEDSKSGSSTTISGLLALASDPLAYIIDLREHDVPYSVRAAIDLDIRVGSWYSVSPEHGSETCHVTWLQDRLERCEPRVLAFDIECEKSPLKFPNAENDRIYMISYMQQGQGFLIINREIVSEDVEDFEYSPKPQFTGPFEVFNVSDEEQLLRKFLDHMQQLRPHVLVTYNGDRFDWPYIDKRCSKYQYLSLYSQLGIKCTLPKRADGVVEGEYIGRCAVHLDAFCWVQRDSYLPQGSQGLKAVTKAKLNYEPVEIDPEDMLRFAQERPIYMAQYSVSDAVATYYLYTTYVHNFIFSLSTIIPMAGEDVLRKGSGTLCEALLMVEAFKCNIICPNKQNEPLESFYGGHLLESETYIGGHVECLEAGVFRADIPEKFSLVPSALQQLIDNIDRDLIFTLEVEHGVERSDITNYDEVRQAIVEKLEMLRDAPQREEPPIIYHLDVGAMYPNIILTNRLQPAAMVTTSDCAACSFNRSENNCKRPMSWTWRGEYSPAGMSEYQSIKRQLTYERFVPASKFKRPGNSDGATATTAGDDSTGAAAARDDGAAGHESNHRAEETRDAAPLSRSAQQQYNQQQQIQQRPFNELPERERMALVRARLKSYSQRVYQKSKVTTEEERVNTVCMRENAFYVDTVKAFRDRRYDYKLLTKEWKKKKGDAAKSGDASARKAAEDKEVLMDSLQLAHKCILNSFYGYVMRKGARWRSMEMAGIVTHTGAQLITQARELVEQVGRPLELDTDGIWCILPASFPQDFKFRTGSGGSVNVGYPCAMLNADVHERYTNHQYQELATTGATATAGNNSNSSSSRGVRSYATHSECSIFFELDGPYKAMILPASPEEGKLLKKKYVVFNYNGTIAELKGFELKRRGELGLVKIFQSQVFEHFLAGSTLRECYEAVGAVANRWLDVLDCEGRDTDDDQLLQLISEKKTISKTIDDYEGRKSTSLTTAARLADFLGAEMVKDKGLNCDLIITRYPAGAPVTERALPVAIFSSEPAVRRYFMRKWLKDPSLDCEDFRDVVDWAYYKDRLGKTIQKIITIPAGIQAIANPCPRVEHPMWLQRRVNERASGKKQMSIMASLANMRINNNSSSSSSGSNSGGAAAAPKLLTDSSSSCISSSTAMILAVGANSPTAAAVGKTKKRVRIMLGDEILDIGSPQSSQQQQANDTTPPSNIAAAAARQRRDIADVEDIGGTSAEATAMSMLRSALGAKVTTFRSPERSMTTKSVDSESVDVDTNDIADDVADATTTSPASSSINNNSSNGNTDKDVEQEQQQQQQQQLCEAVTHVLALNEHPPQSEEELQQWLTSRQDQWKSLRLARRQRKAALFATGSRNYGSTAAATAAGGAVSKRHVGVMDFVRSASLAAAYGFWQVVELQETDILGEFVVWAITQRSQLQRLNVHISRQFYVNINHSGIEAQQAAIKLRGSRVKRELPHGKRCRELFELRIPEQKYQRNERALNLFLCDAQVEGVYESQVPLWFRGVLNMGCVAKVNQQATLQQQQQQSGAAAGYKLQDLELVHVHAHPYLTPQVSTFRRIFLYFASDNSRASGELGILGLFFIETTNADDLELHRERIHQQMQEAYSSNNNSNRSRQKSEQEESEAPADAPISARANVWLINGRANGSLDSKPPLQRIFRKFQPSAAAAVKFTQSFVPTLQEAWQRCSERLTQYERERHGPTIVIVQGYSNCHSTSAAATTVASQAAAAASDVSASVGMDSRQLRQRIPALKDFPVAVMPSNSLDALFPAVGWQLFAAERLLQRYLLFPRWFADRLHCSRYSHIPVCNLGSDALTTMIDVLFSRQLHHNRHLLWASQGARTPDVGKGADSEPCELLDVWSEALAEPVINCEGMYRDICVELDLYGLAICAIMSSSELDAEGLTAVSVASRNTTAAATAEGQGSAMFHSSTTAAANAVAVVEGANSSESMTDASCARSFNIFKALVAKCIDDVSRKAATDNNNSSSSSSISDSILTAVYRYLCGYGNGMLSDPLLHRVVYGLMTKLFQKLVGGLRRLGTKVVHADFSRIIISTGKFEYDAAIEYAEFILAAISHKSTFAFLQVSIKSTWEQLCWLDPENWSGVPLRAPEVTTATAVAAVAGESIAMDTADNDDDFLATTAAATAVEESTPLKKSPKQQQQLAKQQSPQQQQKKKVPSPASTTDVPGEEDEAVETTTTTTTTTTAAAAATTTTVAVGNSDEATGPTAEQIQKNPILAALWKKAPSTTAVATAAAAVKSSNLQRTYGKKQQQRLTTATAADSDDEDLDSLDEQQQKQQQKKADFDFLDAVGSTMKSQSVSIADIKKQYRGSSNSNTLAKKLSSRKNSSTNSDGIDDDADSYDNYNEYDYDDDNSDTDSAAAEDEGQAATLAGDSAEEELQGSWNMASHLPDTAAQFFHFIVGEFMRQFKSKREQLCELRAIGQRTFEDDDNGAFFFNSNSNGSDTENHQQQGTAMLLDDNAITEAAVDYMRKFIQQRFTSKMLEMVDELLELAHHHQHLLSQHQHQHQHRHQEPQRSLFPQRAGSHLSLSSPALEFVKATTHVLLLDPALTSEVGALRRLLLAQLKVREFSDLSNYRDPSLSYVLRDVICSYCSTCRDFDLLRDAALTAADLSARWRCEHCSNRLNTEEVENRLLEAVDKLTAAYLLQDFRCSQSHLVSRRLSSATSDASKPLLMDFSRSAATLSLRVLRQVADFHDFSLLRDSVDELLHVSQ